MKCFNWERKGIFNY